MKRYLSLSAVLLVLAAPYPAAAQRPGGAPRIPTVRPAKGEVEANGRRLPLDTAVVTTHETTIEGKRVPYRAEEGTQPVYGADGSPIATLNYTYYTRTDVSDVDHRPLLISFNGGPGTGSLWMHLGYTGPMRLKIDSLGYPVQPYGVVQNPHSILDATDIVYVNPVNTGFSRALDGVDTKQFFGVNEDLDYLADWIETFVSRHRRWTSPKFLIGESYGTTRVSGLAGVLQDRHWMYLNGVILTSPTGLGIDRGGPVGDALGLPSYAATAWYHHDLAPELQSRPLEQLLADVENFTVDQYIPALTRGRALSDAKRKEIADQVGKYAGISQQYVLDHDLAVPVGAFRKELLRDRGQTVGRLDARYLGVDRENAGEDYDYDPALTAWNHEFAPAINHYLRDVLGFSPSVEYWVFGPVYPWNREGDRTGEQLRQALAENPVMHLLVQSGYFDTGTDYFSAKYTVWQMDPGGKLGDRVQWKGYPAGHMLYLPQPQLAQATSDLRQFILNAVQDAESHPAGYR